MATIRERVNKGGTTYAVLFRDGGRQSSRSFDTRKAAEDFVGTIKALGLRRAIIELDGADDERITLDEIAEQFFAHKATRVRSERTVVDYRRDYDNWIRPEFGNRAAASISDLDVQDWVDRLDQMRRKDGSRRLAAKTIVGHHSLLHGIYAFASAPGRGILTDTIDPCAHTDLPKRVRRPPQPLQIPTWQAMHEALREKGAQNRIGDDAADLGHFLVASGWRISEGIALDTTACDDDGTYITCYMLQVMRRQAGGTFRIVEDAKSQAGGRRVRLDIDTSEMVRRRIKGARTGELVFRRGDERWTYSTFRNVYWAGAARLAGIDPPPKIHRLRHTAVGVFHDSGASLAEVQRRIGHESIQTTLDVYGGMIDDMSDENLDSVAAILRGERKRGRGGR
ncbi:MAG: site-specific integrase [Aeromicrobium sp.]|uniref:tyrosine-type recombinase/integrase n=1 Tax=Aeromicrobium sp. TaxID=1871063 RepID=UPI0039E398DF